MQDLGEPEDGALLGAPEFGHRLSQAAIHLAGGKGGLDLRHGMSLREGTGEVGRRKVNMSHASQYVNNKSPDHHSIPQTIDDSPDE